MVDLVNQLRELCSDRKTTDITISCNSQCMMIDVYRRTTSASGVHHQKTLTWAELMLYPGDPNELVERTLAMLDYAAMKGD